MEGIQSRAEKPTNKHLPLSGIRILDFGQVILLPFATRWLAWMGAEVILIESMKRPVQRVTPPFAFNRRGPNTGARFNTLNHNKYSCTLNLKSPPAVAVVKKLAATSDVVVENFSTGTMDKLGLSYNALRQENPGLVYLSASAFGHTGPWKNYGGFHSTVNALSGLADVTGYPNGQPRLLGAVLPDTLGGIYITLALMNALYHRRQTGNGCYIDYAMLEGLVTIIPQAIIDYSLNAREQSRVGNRDAIKAPHGIYRCKGNDRWVAISIGSNAEWKALCEAFERHDWHSDARFENEFSRLQHRDELDGLMQGFTLHRSSRDIARLLQNAGIPSAPAANVDELLEDPHLKDRGFVVEVDHPEAGRRLTLGLPWKLRGKPEGTIERSPLVGEHNRFVFEDLLGLSSDDVRQLHEQGAIE